MRKLILSLILSGVLCVAGYAQSLNNVEQAVRYHSDNNISAEFNQSNSLAVNENITVMDNRSNSQLEGLGSGYGWAKI